MNVSCCNCHIDNQQGKRLWDEEQSKYLPNLGVPPWLYWDLLLTMKYLLRLNNFCVEKMCPGSPKSSTTTTTTSTTTTTTISATTMERQTTPISKNNILLGLLCAKITTSWQVLYFTCFLDLLEFQRRILRNILGKLS